MGAGVRITRADHTSLELRALSGRCSDGAPALSEQQMAEFRELVIQGPDPAIHKVVRWRCVDLQAEVARLYAVEVPEHYRPVAARAGPDPAAAQAGSSAEGPHGRGGF